MKIGTVMKQFRAVSFLPHDTRAVLKTGLRPVLRCCLPPTLWHTISEEVTVYSSRARPVTLVAKVANILFHPPR